MKNMAPLNRFVFYGEWIDNIKHLPVDIQDKIIADIVRYGIDTEGEYSEDPMIGTIVNFTKGAIDKAKDEYLKKILAGKNYGRKKIVDDEEVYKLAREGKKAAEIAGILGIGKSTVEHNEGWKNRHNDEFVF